MIVKIVNHAIAQRVLTLLLFAALGVAIVLIKPVYRERGRTMAEGQCVLTTPSYPCNAFSNFPEVPVCLKSRFFTANNFYDLSSFDKMVVSSMTCTKCAKSLCRVATFAKASASAKVAADETVAAEHV